MNGYGLPPVTCLHRIYWHFGLQIDKWDEQRENGTFPASLEP
jgi:hypothetical protein